MIELAQIARAAKRSLAEVLPELQAAGLAACPGRAEVFSDGCTRSCSGPSWTTTAGSRWRARCTARGFGPT